MLYNPYSLEGKNILITGASSGIGRSTSYECAKLGANVILTGRNRDKLEEVATYISNVYNLPKPLYHITDLSNEKDIKELVSVLYPIDGVVNNAGIIINKPIKFIKLEDLHNIFNTNLFSAILLNKELIKHKKIRAKGSIVFTSSISSFFSVPGRALYASSKAALTSYMRVCAIELASQNIRSNAVLPGRVETKFVLDENSHDEILRDLEMYPLKRYGKPEEIAWAIIYLLSDASAWVTGSSIIIDGGLTLR